MLCFDFHYSCIFKNAIKTKILLQLIHAALAWSQLCKSEKNSDDINLDVSLVFFIKDYLCVINWRASTVHRFGPVSIDCLPSSHQFVHSLNFSPFHLLSFARINMHAKAVHIFCIYSVHSIDKSHIEHALLKTRN